MRYQDSREPYFFPILPKLTGKGIPRSSFLRDDDLPRRSQSSPMWESNCVTYYSQKRHSVLFFSKKIIKNYRQLKARTKHNLFRESARCFIFHHRCLDEILKDGR